MANPFQPVASMLTEPAITYRRLTLTNPGPPSLFVFAVTVLSVFMHLWSTQTDVYPANPALFVYEATYTFVILVIGILLLTAVLHLSADLLGGAGRGRTLLFFLMLSTLPIWAAGPLAFLLKVVFPLHGLYPFVVAFLLIWSVLLVVLSMRELYRFTFRRALIALILPCAFLSGLAWLMLQIIADRIVLPSL